MWSCINDKIVSQLYALMYDSALVLASEIETFLEELVGKDSGLRKSINAVTNFKVDPAGVDTVGEVVLCSEFFGDVGAADTNVFGTIERSAGGFRGKPSPSGMKSVGG